MMNKIFLYALITLFLTTCGLIPYKSCSITSSGAIFAKDRAKDVKQCWDGVNSRNKTTALAWCEQKVSDYIGKEYIFGHSVTLQVALTNCP